MLGDNIDDERYIKIVKVSDLKQRIGYSLKENKYSIIEGYDDDQIEIIQDYYNDWEIKNNIKNELKDIIILSTSAKAVKYLCGYIKLHHNKEMDIDKETILHYIQQTIKHGVHYDLSIRQKHNVTKFLYAHFGDDNHASNCLVGLRNEFDYDIPDLQ